MEFGSSFDVQRSGGAQQMAVVLPIGSGDEELLVFY
jgi:hypothetical protein